MLMNILSCWDGYFSSYLQVVFGLSLTNAGYLANTYTMGSCVWGLVVGVFVPPLTKNLICN